MIIILLLAAILLSNAIASEVTHRETRASPIPSREAGPYGVGPRNHPMPNERLFAVLSGLSARQSATVESFSLDPLGGFRARFRVARLQSEEKHNPIEAEDASVDIDGRLSFSARGGLFEGRMTLESRVLMVNGSRFDRVRMDFNGRLRVTTGIGIDLDGDSTLSFSEHPAHDVDNPVKRISVHRVKSKLRWNDRVLQISGDLQLSVPPFVSLLPLSFNLEHRFDAGNGKLTFDAGSFVADRIKKELFPILPMLSKKWPGKLALAAGGISLDGVLRWGGKEAAPPLTALIGLSDIGGSYGNVLFSGLKGRFETTIGDRIRSRATDLSLSIIDVGIPITELRGAITLDPDEGKSPVITIDNLSAKLLGGRISEPRIRLDLNRKTNAFNIGFQDIDLASLVAMHRLEGLEARGKLRGNLPLRLGPKGARIQNARIIAMKPGGRIRYRPNDGARALAQSAGRIALLLDVLDDFHYHALEATANYTPDGELRVHMAIKGRGAEVDEARPVDFNLRIEQNIISLLKSLRFVNGINERLGKSVRRHYSRTAGGSP
uniref:Dicarboxylate transport n=2 Tax=Candidatus Kentrum sp. SD TaxID=2126332 RepID=A0A450Z357_9GAMM|nr:MAG: Dicarboxylate transport [Candidatus Kentron sp. SD]VFK48221.1 MAG: Dicarboxylate transport [Candidatus Kentron sp. SD]